jgi:SSS family solute:Na+ symporter
MVGGLKAVVFTDVAQVWVIILVFGGIFSYSLLNEASSFFSFSSLMATQQLFTLDHQAISTSSLIATIMLPALFSLIEQDLAQRFFAARTPKIAAISAIIASIFLLTFSFIPIYFGMKAKLFGMIIPTGTSPLLPVLEAISSQLVLVLAVCAIIAAITSTADSLLCAVSSNVAQDFDFSFTGIKNQVTISQIVTCITGLTVLGASYVVSPNIIGILISSYEISVSCLFVPLIYSYFSTNLKKNSAIGGIIAGLIGFFLFRFFPIAIPKEIAAIGLSFIGYHLGSLKK